MPCREFLLQLQEAAERLEAAGASVVVVSGQADYQARQLRDDGVTIPLLLDPDGRLRGALGFGRMAWWRMLSPSTVRNYLGAFRNARPGAIAWADAIDEPGVVILDAGLREAWRHQGAAVGDYPSIQAVLDALVDIG